MRRAPHSDRIEAGQKLLRKTEALTTTATAAAPTKTNSDKMAKRKIAERERRRELDGEKKRKMCSPNARIRDMANIERQHSQQQQDNLVTKCN